MKPFNNKAIYQPAGKAGEYAKWACNFYVGCSNGCEYCYCKKGIMAGVMGQDKPQLKKCFKSDDYAFDVFLKEMNQNIDELKLHGIFFSFTTDPMLPETKVLTIDAALNATLSEVPVKILTKRTDWVDDFLNDFNCLEYKLFYEINPSHETLYSKKHLWAFGFTLTDHDELEKGASTNQERIEAMRKLHDAGFKTFASIEPIIDFNSSMYVIERTLGWCDLYKIGLMSGQKVNKQFKTDLTHFVGRVCMLANRHKTKVYWKNSITKIMDIVSEASVGADYNLFDNGR